LDEAGVFIDEVGEAVVVEGSIDVQDDGALDLVASVEGVGLFGKEAMGLGNLRCRGVCEIRECWENRTNKWHSWGASFARALLTSPRRHPRLPFPMVERTDWALALHCRSRWARLL
jgi:hypothetical protein